MANFLLSNASDELIPLFVIKYRLRTETRLIKEYNYIIHNEILLPPNFGEYSESDLDDKCDKFIEDYEKACRIEKFLLSDSSDELIALSDSDAEKYKNDRRYIEECDIFMLWARFEKGNWRQLPNMISRHNSMEERRKKLPRVKWKGYKVVLSDKWKSDRKDIRNDSIESRLDPPHGKEGYIRPRSPMFKDFD